MSMEIKDGVAVVTGAASGIGSAVANELARRGTKAIALVDRCETVMETGRGIERFSHTEVQPFMGDTTDADFRKRVFDRMCDQYGTVNLCVPAAGITRDALAVKTDRETGETSIYSPETFRLVIEVDLIAPIYWALETVARIAKWRQAHKVARWKPEEGIQGVIILVGSVSSNGVKGQIAYSTAKAGLDGAAATLSKEATFYGVRCGIIHPGFTDTPMVRALGDEYIRTHILPDTQLGRLIRPEEIADAICFMISNSAVSSQLWADAGWHPAA
jgi:NAD(P)-dependent dehydrogenase (short-subunit alcohol dehydrogenase family)